LLFLGLGIIFSTVLWLIEMNNTQARKDIGMIVLEELGSKEVVTEDVKQYIQSVVTNRGHIYEIEATYIGDKSLSELSSEPFPSLDYQYKEDIWAPDWSFITLKGQAYSNKNWYIDMGQRSYDGLALVILLLGGFIYWILFSIWAIYNSYKNKRLNLGWLFVISFFNILGYLLFRKISYK
jgi:hypothetical protein